MSNHLLIMDYQDLDCQLLMKEPDNLITVNCGIMSIKYKIITNVNYFIHQFKLFYKKYFII